MERGIKMVISGAICLIAIFYLIVFLRTYIFEKNCENYIIKNNNIIKEIKYKQAIFVFNDFNATSMSDKEINKVLEIIYESGMVIVEGEEKDSKICFELSPNDNEYNIKLITMNVLDDKSISLNLSFRKSNLIKDCSYIIKLNENLNMEKIMQIFK